LKSNKKVYALVDCNSFFCSCERLFRPDIKNKPVGVLSNNDGCFVSRTPELKKLGVPMGAPYFKYKELCDKNDVQAFSSNFALYTNISDRVMTCLSQFTPDLEVYSVDEAFLDLTGFDNVEAYAHLIKETVLKEVGVPVSVGVAPTKTLAKLANYHAKKNKVGVVTLLEEERQTKFLEKTPISEVWGVGRASASKFESLRVKTAKDYRDYKNHLLIKKVFTKVGLQRLEELQGKSRFLLNQEIQKKKGIMASRSFGMAVTNISDLRAAVATHASKACERLREQDSYCSYVGVSIRNSPFKNSFYYKGNDGESFESPTQDTTKVVRYALNALDKIFKAGFDYKKAGVSLHGIKDEKDTQLSLFEAPDSKKSKDLMKAVDQINKTFGAQTLKLGVCGLEEKSVWAMRMERKSPHYVTGWSELPKVK